MSNMSDSVTFLGTSDGLPSADRHHASLLLRKAGQTILLDCGEPCSHTLKRMGVGFNTIDAVVISHTHSDHVAGLPMLIQSMWLEQRTRPLPIWMPRRAIRPLQNWLTTCFLFEQQFKFCIQWRALSEKTPVRVGPVRVAAYRTSHLDETRKHFAGKNPGVGFDAFCLVLETGDKRIGYSGDIGKPSDLLPLMKKSVDLLIVEVAHCAPGQLLAFLRDRPIRHVAFTHLSRSARARLQKFRRNALHALRPARVTFACDGDTIAL
jgi:ribonuclease BN (tRNA processing enzyme)